MRALMQPDINKTAARYLTDGKIPFDIGLEVSYLLNFYVNFNNYLTIN